MVNTGLLSKENEMKKLLLIIALVFSFGAEAGKFGEREKLECGGRTIVDMDNLVTLYGNVEVAGQWTTLIDHNDTSGYQVSGSLEIFCIRMYDSAAANLFFTIGYGDTDVGVGSGSAPTTPIYASGRSGTGANSTTNIFMAPNPDAASGLHYHEYGLSFDIPHEKYPFIKGATGTGVSQSYVFFAVKTASGA